MRNYICHARGAFNVLHALGPANIVSEGEKDLLIAQAEVMVSVGTMREASMCFTDSARSWKQHLRMWTVS
jgi:hypothetical protein